MLTLGRRYTHVPLGVVSVLLVVAIIAWLLERRVDGVWDPALRMAAPVPVAVTLAAVPSPAPGAAEATPAWPAEPAAPVTPPPPADPPPVATPASPPAPVVPPPAERYALESGPFLSAEAADRVEDQLNHLGYPTVRFRTQEVRPVYVVTVTGFASTRDARRVQAEIGRGTVVSGEDGVELQVDRLTALGEAIAAARPVRARGYDVRVDEDLRLTVIYHVRYGQFVTQAAAEARGEELALFGLPSRAVKIR
jgi:cell division protein FtsN